LRGGTLETESSETVNQARNVTEEPSPAPLHDFLQLQRDNPDCIGWVSIPGTDIDFPVMQSTDVPEFYLKHDFNGNYTDYGLPFLDERCSLATSDNLIIYGHHMNDGSMFSELLQYEDKSYFEQHPEIILETVLGVKCYKVAAVIQAAGSYEPDTWSIFNCIDLDTGSFERMKQELADRQFYETGIDIAMGDRLLTLATCEYSQYNGRLAVVAIKSKR
jgi:sortase B